MDVDDIPPAIMFEGAPVHVAHWLEPNTTPDQQINECRKFCQDNDKCQFWVIRRESRDWKVESGGTPSPGVPTGKAVCHLRGVTANIHRIMKKDSDFGPRYCWHSKQLYIYI